MLLPFSSKPKSEKVLILDIQSGLVRGALVEYIENQPAVIRSLATKSIETKTHTVNSVQLTKKILKLVHQVVEHVAAGQKHGSISSIHYILSSPWVFSQLKTLSTDYQKETEINSSIIDGIVDEEFKKQKASFQESSEDNADVYPVEQKIFEIKLNGYPVTNVEKKRARKLEISLSTSFSSKSFLNKLYFAVHKVIDIDNHFHHSALMLQYASLRSILHDKNDYIYMHVHSELTDVVIVKGGLCKHISSFPLGTMTLLRKIAHTTRQSIEASDSLLALYQGDKLDENEKKRTKKIIEPLVSGWSAMCMKSLSASFDIMEVPRTVFVSAHSHFEIFKGALLFQNDLSFDIIPYNDTVKEDAVLTDKGVPSSTLMKMYALALRNLI